MLKTSTEPKDPGEAIEINVVQVTPSPPDGGWGWLICLSTFYCNFIIVGLQTSFGLLYVGMMDTFHDSASKTSLSGAFLSGFTMLVGPFVSGLLTFYSHRCVIIAGALIASAAMFAGAFATRVEMIIITYGLIGGIALGMVFFTANVIIGMYFVKRRALAFSLANCGSGAGMFSLNYAIRQLLDRYAFRGTLIIISGLVLNIVVFGALCRPVDCNTENSEESQEMKDEPTSSQTLISAKELLEDSHFSEKESETCTLNKRLKRPSDVFHVSSMEEIEVYVKDDKRKQTSNKKKYIKETCASFFDFSILKNPYVLALSLTYIFWAANTIPMVFLPAYLLSIDRTKDEVALLMSISGIACTVGQFLVGILVDFAHVPSQYLLTLSMVTLAAFTFAMTIGRVFWSITLIVMIWSITLGFGISLRVIVAMDLTGMDDFSRAYSQLMLFNGIGYAIAPPLSGWLFDVTHSFSAIFYSSAASL